MEITPRELRDIEIHSEIRGYSRDEVNDLLERAAAAIDAANQRVTQVQDRLTSAQSEAGRTRETEDILHRTLLLAQRAADEAVAEATAKSRQMLDEAEMSSRRLVAEAEAEARRKGETERRRLEEEIVELAGRRDALLADVEALTRFEAEYRERMTRALESDLTALKTRPTNAPGTKPETTDVEIPESTSVPASSVPASSVSASSGSTSSGPNSDSTMSGSTGFGSTTPPAPASPSTPTRSPVGNTVPASTSPVSTPASGPVATVPSTSDAADAKTSDTAVDAAAGTAAPLPSGSPFARAAADQNGGPETSEVDVRTLFEQAHEQSREQNAKEQAEAAAPRPQGLQPIDLASGDLGAVDADVLDDDAFFATLRDAVDDESPLGPREEGDDVTGENRFFDQDAERGTFRDVFRRRR